MSRLAIVIAVSEYQSVAHLPACRQDGAAVADLLRRTGRFDEVLHISGGNETISSSVKTRLSALADQFRECPIYEILFYFSGHGDFDGDDFRYLLSDYNPKKKNQTTLSNIELDGIFRRLNPDLFVKVIDACHSGISYIKGDEDFTTYLKGSQAGFKNIYFMFSSQAEESSYATERVSYFTHTILKAIVEAPDGPIRYRDLMSAASDDFAIKGGQTPQFIVQATNTEIFCEVNEGLRAALRPYIRSELVVEEEEEKTAFSLLERIQRDEADYCTQDEAGQVLEALADALLDLNLSDELRPLFSVGIEEKSGIAPVGNAIGHWLNDNVDKGYFAKPTKKSEPYTERTPKSISAIAAIRSISAGAEDDYYQTVTKYRQVVDSYRITTEQPFGHLVLELAPNMKALAPFQCIVAPIVSRTHLMLFWRYIGFDYSDWDKPVQQSSSNWSRAEVRLRDTEGLKQILEDIVSGLQNFVLIPLLERWPAPASPDNAEGSPVQLDELPE